MPVKRPQFAAFPSVSLRTVLAEKILFTLERYVPSALVVCLVLMLVLTQQRALLERSDSEHSSQGKQSSGSEYKQGSSQGASSDSENEFAKEETECGQ